MKIELIQTHIAEVFGPVLLYVGLFFHLGEPIRVQFPLLLLQNHKADWVLDGGIGTVIDGGSETSWMMKVLCLVLTGGGVEAHWNPFAGN